MASIAAVSHHTIESIEYGRLNLSPGLALRVSKACAVDFNWLVNDNAGEEIISDRGERYSLRDFEEAQERDQTLAFWHSVPEMEIARGYDLLLRAYREARATPMNVPTFSRELAQFVERQVRKIPKLRDEVERENRERDKRHRKKRPYLWPSSSEQLKRARKKLNESIASVRDWEGRYAARTKSVTKK
jgi:hypothetical protein